jgi:4-amino-4-deoxy-L-arabinose transferase-like glycosyltransferase
MSGRARRGAPGPSPPCPSLPAPEAYGPAAVQSEPSGRLAASAYLGILLVALAVRLPAVTAGYPYLNYVDEGHVLLRVLYALRTGDWDPGWYIYPALPVYAILGAVHLYSPVYALVHGRPLRADLPPAPVPRYDWIGPPEVLLVARTLGLLVSLGTVALAGWLAARLAGRAAGLLAAWLAALLPALVIRGAIVNVDVYATFFVLAALCFAERVREPAGGAAPRQARRDAFLAGAMTGLALVSKYPHVLVALPVAAAVLLAPRAGAGEKLRRLGLAGGAAVLASAVSMPALALRTGKVAAALRYEASLYTQSFGSYWDQAVRRAEWDLPFDHPEVGWPLLLLAAASLGAALADRREARAVLGWAAYAAALGWLLSRFGFHPFRNLLPLVPLLAVLPAGLYQRLRRRARRATSLAASRLLAAAAIALPPALFAAPLAPYLRHMCDLVDSRHQAVSWLAAHGAPGDTVVVAGELAFLPGELRRVPGSAAELPWAEARLAIRQRRCRFAVLGEMWVHGQGPLPAAAWAPEVMPLYAVRAAFGEEGPNGDPAFVFHGNRQRIYVLERRAAR